MIKILQTGQVGATRYLFDMHKVRTRIFRDRMGWDVHVNDMQMEVDEYDLPETIYILSIDEQGQVVGTWRFLMNTEPSMICNIWPQYLKTLPIPASHHMCETSRFGVVSRAGRFGAQKDEGSPGKKRALFNIATAEMIVALIEVCIMCGITDMFTLYDVKIKNLLDKIGFSPEQISEVIDLEGKPTISARFKMDQLLLETVKSHVDVEVNITAEDLPPLLKQRFLKKEALSQMKIRYAS